MATWSNDLAEQIIDALLAEDESRYEAYRSVRAEADVSRAERAPSEDVAYAMGVFIGEWARLEGKRGSRCLTSTRRNPARAPRSVERLDRPATPARRDTTNA